MKRAPLVAIAVALSACSYDQALKDYCIDIGACSCNETTCCIQHGFSCHAGYACCDGFVCNGETGTCLRPADATLEIVPSSYDFGFMDVGGTRTLPVTVMNTGPGASSPLVFGAVQSPFSVDATGCAGQVLAPGASCQFTLTTAPVSAGRFATDIQVTELTSRAHFSAEVHVGVYPVTVNPTGAADRSIVSTPPGIQCPGSCRVDFPVGTALTIGRGSSEGTTWGGFSGDCLVADDTSCSLVVDGPKTIFVNYLANLTLDIGYGGFVTIAGFPTYYSGGRVSEVAVSGTVVLSATPFVWYQFTGWGDACARAGTADCTLDIVGHVTVSASFIP